ncbi:MAG: ParB/RepB/Spo0J family partition protein [Clostridiales bacterium]|nr:ParB/RepB/Spo0J family partition protein [Clostridiales bacterium]
MSVFSIRKEAKADPEPELRLEEIPVRLIIPNPNQPRRAFDEAGIGELAASIKQVGLLQPLLVRRAGGFYELIAGERRLRAVRKLGWKSVRCIITGGTDENDSALMAIVENLQREDLHFFEEAESYARLLERLRVTQEELAARIGKSQGFVANKLRLLKLSPETRRAVIEGGLSERHARAVLKLPTDLDRETAVRRIASGGLSVKESEKLVERMLASNERQGGRRRPKIIRVFRDYKLFVNTVEAACGQLRESGLKVEVAETPAQNGVDISIKVRR